VIIPGVSAGSAQWSNKVGDQLLARVLTGLIGIPLFLGFLYIGKWPLFVLVAAMGIVGFHEYARMWRAKGIHVSLWIGWIASLAIFTWAVLAPENGVLLGGILTGTMLTLLCWVVFGFRSHTVMDAFVSVSGIVYVGWLLSHLLLLRGLGAGTGWDVGLKWVTLAFFSTWVADSTAYFFGRAFGKQKLAPDISPKKTVEGAIGGGLSALLVAALWGPVVGITAWQGGLIGAGVSVLSVLGDLAESALKRYTGVKDSGALLPGHGGVLDRFDSSLFVLPFVYYIAKLVFGA
jgi:phosphatidate cytidylyltransferase